ncbi:MAG: cupin domain-containing protein [Halioglobus sp.]|nr:cupin domain-containing protein [Halioglobus sp.]
MPRLHPDLDIMMEYSAGTLPLAQSACVFAHIENCAQCRQLVAELSDVGGALLAGLDPVPVGDSQLDAVLARLDEEPPLQYSAPARAPDSLPAVLQRLMRGDFSDLSWKSIGKSLRISYLSTGDTQHEFALYHIKAGGRVPEHDHCGSEMTLVLEGGFSDAEGSYHKGDFIFRRPGDVHSPTALQSEDCICVAVLDAPLKFMGWKFRWMNPFFKLRAS